MNAMKRMLSLLLVMAMMLSLAACGGGEATVETEAASGETGTYTVSIKSAGGMKMEGVDVYIYADDTLADLKQYGETDAEGVVNFTMEKSSDYAIVVSGAPKGYAVESSYAFNGNSAAITLTSSLIQGENLSGAILGLGDIMYDFSIKTADGQDVMLSEMLAEKDMVLLNFFFTTCGPCANEFP